LRDGKGIGLPAMIGNSYKNISVKLKVDFNLKLLVKFEVITKM